MTADAPTPPPDMTAPTVVVRDWRDELLTPEEFAAWLRVDAAWVRERLGTMPGVIHYSRKTIRIHPRTFLNQFEKSHGKRS